MPLAPDNVNVNILKATILGSVFVAMSQICGATAETIGKKSKLTVMQMQLGRIIIHFVVSILWWNIKKPHSVKNWYGDKPHITNVWIRGLLFGICGTLFYYAIITLPLGDLQCLLYISPLIAVLFASVWLKEKLPDIYILIPSILLTVCGVILVSQPSFIMNMINIRYVSQPLRIDGVVSIILAALLWAFCTLLVRKAITSHFLQLELAVGVCFFLIGLPLTALLNTMLHSQFIGSLDFWDNNTWRWDLDAIICMLSIGLLGFCTVLFSVKGYQYGEATMVSWLEYITIPISFMSQTFIFHDTPNVWESIGAGMVSIGALLPFIQQVIQYIYFGKKMRYNQVAEEGDVYEEQELMQIYSATESD